MNPGQELLHYRLIEKIGQGGMGVVWKAEDTRLQRHVALKFVPAERAQDPHAVERHLREARAASSLNHPHICQIHDIGEWEGRRFIVMELLEGRSLAERIGGTPIDVDQAVELAIQIADALDAAHGKGIVHRDIKTANIVVSDRGQAKVLDFGLAKLAAPSDEGKPGADEATRTALEITQPGSVVGTVTYMSPEQALGKELDARMDIFSLGVVLYEMITGQRAFEGATSAAVFDAILNRAPTAPVQLNAQVPPELERIVNRALEKDPGLRYQSAADLGADLRRVRRDSTTSARPAPETSRPRGRGGLLAVGAFAALALIILMVVWMGREADAPPDPAASTGSSASVAGLSIAVLPFVNATGDPEQRYFSEGLGNDIVNELSRYGELAVMPCRSGLCESGNADAREIGRSLGAKYVLQGRVQSTAKRIRVSVQLFDGSDGRLIWGDDHESEMTARDLFDLQDGLTEQVVSAIAGSAGVLAREELAGARRTPPTNLDSYYCIFRVYEYLQHHFAEYHLAARDCLEDVVEAEPDYVDGLAWLSYLYSEEFHHRWHEGEIEYDSRARALSVGERAVRLDDSNSLAHAYLGMTLLFHGESERGLAEMYRALDLHPSNPSTMTLLANYLSYQGDFARASPLARRAIALNPNPPVYIDMPLFMESYYNGRYEEALELSKMGVVGNKDFREPLFLAATYGQLGRIDEAQAALDELRTLWTRPMNEIRQELIERHAFSPEIADRLIDGAVKAGLEIPSESQKR